MILREGGQGRSLAEGHLTTAGRKREFKDLMKQKYPAGSVRKKPEVLAQAVLYSSWKNRRLAVEQAEPSSRQHSGGAEV